MKIAAILALMISLLAAPAFAGLIQVQELDEAATCELRGAAMVTPAPENGVIFPREESCAAAEADGREEPQREGAIEIAGNFPAANH